MYPLSLRNEESLPTKDSDDILDEWSCFPPSSFGLPDPSSSEESSRESSPSSSSSTSKKGLTEAEMLAYARQRHLSSHTSQHRTGVCRWQTPWGICNHTLDSDRGTVSQHLKRCHQYSARKPRQLIRCQWEGCNSKPMQASTLGRHVKTHLGFMNNTCPKCNGVYTRDSSLDRHLETCDGTMARRRRTRFTGLAPRSAKEEVLGTSMFTQRIPY
ncbi:hypothetical protein BT96DRAFT_48831 [Gymnopus androsaceus JB14]|uniref:C2H2-type domain-containing protein n=1 Tax=Gymnopus androsaceus JB14 TaxID=1447944 RepID=A0A6A4HHC1_9AGAR|nr:hypothetical protein BT96DRAFT_48831 [Gymnopus androsaceus JB14]